MPQVIRKIPCEYTHTSAYTTTYLDCTHLYWMYMYNVYTSSDDTSYTDYHNENDGKQFQKSNDDTDFGRQFHTTRHNNGLQNCTKDGKKCIKHI